MNPRYTYKVELHLDHGNTQPSKAEIEGMEHKVSSIAELIFGGLVLGSTVEVQEDEEEEKDYTVYAEVTVCLQCNVSVTAVDEMVANDVAVNLFNESNEFIYLSTDNAGVELDSSSISNINIVNVEESPQGENG